MTAFARLSAALHAHSRARHFLEGALVAIAVCALVASIGRTEFVDKFERQTLDHRFRYWADRKPEHPDVIVVELTNGDLQSVKEKLGRAWPWDRDAYGFATEFLAKCGAKAVFFDFSYQDSPDNRPDKDLAFANSVQKAGNVFIIATFGKETRFPELMPALEARSVGPAPPWMPRYDKVEGPFPEIIPAARGIVSPIWSSNEIDPDTIGRRYSIGSACDGKAYLSPAVAMASFGLGQPVTFEAEGARIGDLLVPADEHGSFIVNWHAKRHEYNPRGRTLAGLVASLKKSTKEPYDPAEFKDKYVFIGASADGLYDNKTTPMKGTLYGVELHAAAMDTILTRQFVRRTPRWLFVFTVLTYAFVAGIAGLFFRIRWLLPLVLLIAAGHTALAWWFLGHGQVWLDVVAPLAALFLATSGSAFVNYAVEGRQKRDIRAKFGTYLTPEYVKLLEENPGMFKLGGEERVGTAFFSDLSGFTAMSEKMSASELVSRMNEYLTLMTRSIKRFRGTVDKYEGDAIVAFWNAPIVQPDHAVLACRAALDNQAELAKLRVEWKEKYGVSVVARIGLNTGKMIFGNMGSDDKFNYTMMGDPVNLAARLESANKDYSTYLMIGPDTYELVKDVMECRELDLIKVKGKQIPVTVYELLCEKGGLDPRTKEMLERYTLGLQAYRMKQFIASERLFRETLEIMPDDGPSKLYLERSRQLVEKPPEPGWTYVYEKKDK